MRRVLQVIVRHHQMRYDGAGERLLLGVVAITRFAGGGRPASETYFTYGTLLANRMFYAHDLAGNRTREVVYWLPLGRGVRILLLREVES